MVELNFPERKEQKKLAIGMHISVIVFMIGYQTLEIVTVGATVTGKGYLTYLLEILTFYLFQYWVLPKAFDKKSRGVFPIRFALLILLFITIRGFIIDPKRKLIEFLHFVFSLEQLMYASVILFIVLGLSFIMGLYKRNEHLGQEYIRAFKAKMESDAEKRKVENAMLQMRLSTHLQFNTLNYIQAKANNKVPEIEKSVNLYSGLLRHSMIDIQTTPKVLLLAEIAEVKNLIELYKQLAEDNFYIDFTEQYHDADMEISLPPSTLLTFVENVARYGIVHDAEFPATVKIWVEGRNFTFETRNYKKRSQRPGSGLGIKSVASTLGYYYPGSHTLQIDDGEEIFSLKLTIRL